MKIRNGAQTGKLAKTWLLQDTWGQDFVRQLGANPGGAHRARWLAMVVDMHAARHPDGGGTGWGTVPGVERDEPDDADDVAGFQAMSAELYE